MYIVYGFNECPYCQKAKRLLDSNGIEYTYENITEKSDRTQFMDVRGFEHPNRTFPKIYQDGELIGGCDELEIHLFLEGF